MSIHYYLTLANRDPLTIAQTPWTSDADQNQKLSAAMIEIAQRAVLEGWDERLKEDQPTALERVVNATAVAVALIFRKHGFRTSLCGIAEMEHPAWYLFPFVGPNSWITTSRMPVLSIFPGMPVYVEGVDRVLVNCMTQYALFTETDVRTRKELLWENGTLSRTDA